MTRRASEASWSSGEPHVCRSTCMSARAWHGTPSVRSRLHKEQRVESALDLTTCQLILSLLLLHRKVHGLQEAVCHFESL